MGKSVTRYDERFAKEAEKWAEQEKPTGEFISVRGGTLAFQGDPMPGNQMCVIILNAVKERKYFTHDYDPTAEFNRPPVCYAFGTPISNVARGESEEDEMGPHESMQSDLDYFEPQNDICKTCPNNEWGSSDTGRGKACGERRRIAVIPAGIYKSRPKSRDFDLEIIEDPEHYETADIAYLSIPVMSVKDWARYLATLGGIRRPAYAVITRVFVEPDPKSQFRVKFEVLEEVPEELIDVIDYRVEEAGRGIVFGYTAPSGSQDDEDEDDRPRKKKKKVRRG